uniref:NADH-ubiquinone oxidoreductase chain 4L n=1 Tax=Psococerastis albimaculata TaxID=1264641 RepID=M9P701_9NEOP|nr:NADH dehydrogenase subunit 4L [Psococerastis albimaculata]AFY16893.1 NADH dehydrogenase subunit 4L [Psococerastis albimaculata]
MLMKMFILFLLFFFTGLYKFSMKNNHLLVMLVSLEFMSLIIFFMLMFNLWMFSEKYILMYYLTFCVCEGAFGLSLLVCLVRSVGNDYYQNMSFLKC